MSLKKSLGSFMDAQITFSVWDARYLPQMILHLVCCVVLYVYECG